MVGKHMKSSALLIAIMVGILMSLVVVGASATIGEQFKNSTQSREGRLAYRAAVSGLEDGLMRVKYAKSSGKIDKAYNINEKNITSSVGETPEMSYQLSVKTTSLTTNDSDIFTKWTSIPDQSRPPNEIRKNLKKINIDDVLDLDITYSIKNEDLSKLVIYFSDPRISDIWLEGVFTSLNVKLIDTSGNISSINEQQLKFEKTNNDMNAYQLSIESDQIAKCKTSGSQCHLRIRPMISSKSSMSRLSGILPSSSAGKYIYYAVKAYNTSGELLKNETQANPGSISIESIGYAGRAVRKLEAVIDTSTGSYQAIFDFGVYCGTNCDNLSANQ